MTSIKGSCPLPGQFIPPLNSFKGYKFAFWAFLEPQTPRWCQQPPQPDYQQNENSVDCDFTFLPGRSQSKLLKLCVHCFAIECLLEKGNTTAVTQPAVRDAPSCWVFHAERTTQNSEQNSVLAEVDTLKRQKKRTERPAVLSHIYRNHSDCRTTVSFLFYLIFSFSWGPNASRAVV